MPRYKRVSDIKDVLRLLPPSTHAISAIFSTLSLRLFCAVHLVVKVRKRKLRLSLVFSNANASFGNWCNSTTAALIWAETAGWMDMFCVFHYQNNGGLSCSRIQYVTHQTNCTLATDHRITNINLCQRSFHRMSCFVFVCFFRIYASCLLYCLTRTHTSGDFFTICFLLLSSYYRIPITLCITSTFVV